MNLPHPALRDDNIMVPREIATIMHDHGCAAALSVQLFASYKLGSFTPRKTGRVNPDRVSCKNIQTARASAMRSRTFLATLPAAATTSFVLGQTGEARSFSLPVSNGLSGPMFTPGTGPLERAGRRALRADGVALAY